MKLTTDQVLVFDWIAGSGYVNDKQGRVVRKPVNANPGLKVNRNITLSFYKNIFYCFCLVYFVIIQSQNRRPNNIQKTYREPHRKVIKILSYPGLAFRL